jgi:peptide-methionine (S)-S-oxide reductase
LDTAYFASGCFWCTEAVFERVEGVVDVVSGYSGGTKQNPTYEEVGAGLTNYAEAVRIAYDPEKIGYKLLIEMFYASHDPTQLNRQGPDIGKQYRSSIFYRTEEEKTIASEIKDYLDKSGKYQSEIATTIVPFKNFYEAEAYHQNYYELHPNQPYVYSVSRPKVEKFVKEFETYLKEQYKK